MLDGLVMKDGRRMDRRLMKDDSIGWMEGL